MRNEGTGLALDDRQGHAARSRSKLVEIIMFVCGMVVRYAEECTATRTVWTKCGLGNVVENVVENVRSLNEFAHPFLATEAKIKNVRKKTFFVSTSCLCNKPIVRSSMT